jgi:hypothetical protein
MGPDGAFITGTDGGVTGAYWCGELFAGFFETRSGARRRIESSRPSAVIKSRKTSHPAREIRNVLRPSILNLAKAITPDWSVPCLRLKDGEWRCDRSTSHATSLGRQESVMSNLRIWTLISGCWKAITCAVYVVPITLCAVALVSSGSGVAAQEPTAYEFTLIADIGSSTASLNNRGTVSFIAWTSAGKPAVFTGNGGPLTLLADGDAPFSGFGAWNTSINANGTVAFIGDLIGDGAGIFTASRRGVNTIARTGDGLAGVGLRPSINNAGTVAFLGGTAAGGVGLFAGRGDAVLTL